MEPTVPKSWKYVQIGFLVPSKERTNTRNPWSVDVLMVPETGERLHVYHNGAPTKKSEQIFLLNCMSVMDPQLLLQRLMNTCSSHGGSQSAELTSDYSRYVNERCVERCDNSVVFSSLPLAIKWLRDNFIHNHSARYQVLVTGSLHLVGGDVLKLVKR